jgi:hypothetical protein
MMLMTNLMPPFFALLLFMAIPALTLVLLRRAGVRGAKLALSLVPPMFLLLGAFVFQWLMTLDFAIDFILHLAVAKSIGVCIGAVSPLIILAVVKWPVLDNSRLHVETFK